MFIAAYDDGCRVYKVLEVGNDSSALYYGGEIGAVIIVVG